MGLFDKWNDVANGAVNFVTLGFAGVNESGDIDWDEGYKSQFYDEIIGGITGRNIARKEMYNAEERLKVEESRRAQDIVDQNTKKYQKDVQSSFTALSIRNKDSAGGGGAAGGGSSSGGSLGGSDEDNILGV